MELFILLVFFVTILTAEERVSYKNYKVYSVQPRNILQDALLNQWENNEGIDFWQKSRDGHAATVMVRPDTQSEFKHFLEMYFSGSEIIIDDVESTITAEREQGELYSKSKAIMLGGANRSVDFEHFWTYSEISEYINTLAKQYPNLVQVFDLGQTFEGRSIEAITISLNGKVDGSKPIVFTDGGIHAREWAAPMSLMHLIYELVERTDAHLSMLENTDWVIIPVANPDGYTYTHTTARLWRKNRNPNNSLLCPGVDLNRNFDYQWKKSSLSCADTFAGAAGNSEAETQALSKFMQKYEGKIKVYLAIHSYGQYILYPWGYDDIKAPNWQQLQEIGNKAKAAVMAVGGGEYSVGNSAELLYTASGASDDYAYGTKGIQLAYTIELTGGGRYGFDLPASSIKKVAAEAFEMFKVFGVEAAALK